MEMRAKVSKKLGQAVNKICKGPDTANAFEDFMEETVDAEEFMDYFKAIWYPRIGSFFLLSNDNYMGYLLYNLVM